MLQDNVETSHYQESMEQAVKMVEKRGFDQIKARVEDYEAPASLKKQGEDLEYTPDITAKKDGATYYFEIADRKEDATSITGKWKLLSTLAEMKGGQLEIFVPYGSMKFTREILVAKNIEAEVIKL